jgi:Ca2+-transporting ATPase
VSAASEQRGLTEAEAQERLVRFGPNEIARPPRRTMLSLAVGALREPMFLLLLAAVALYLFLGDLAEGLFLGAGAAVAIGLVIGQELRSEKALAALRELAQPSARVLRDGGQRRIPTSMIVPGDLMLVGEGERLAADGELVAGDVLTIDESALTGESAPVARRPGAGEEAGVLAGTLVVGGQGSVRVTLTGARTAFGRIGASLATAEEEATPLQKTARRLVAFLGAGAVTFCLLVTLLYGLIRSDWVEAGLSGLTVAIALIPEEFPMVLAVFLALGAWRLARHDVIVRRAAVIETLGAASMLCVDKTGTLTENRMTLARVWTPAVGRALEPNAGEAAAAIVAGSLASAQHSIDPLDRAILERAPASAAKAPVRTWPLSAARSAVVQVWDSPAGQIAAAKGAPETVLRLCRLRDDESPRVQAALEELASDGYRVLGVASWRGGAFPATPEEAHFSFEGLLAFVDPLRADVPAALAEARAAGIAVAMITGDHPATALAIARSAGIDTRPGVMRGEEIAALSVDELEARLETVRVFARVQPDQKLKLVQAFRARGAVVAMTGDGVNDAPALEAAHIGIAMGRRGTDVAREAADLVLLEDSFASIVGGVRLGRRIFANLRRALTYITAIHVPIAGLALFPLLLGLPPMLFPMHVVLLELVVDPVCSLVFEGEPSETAAMRRPPRNPRESLFGPRQIAGAFVQGAVVTLAVLALYAWSLGRMGEAEARAMALAALVIGNIALALANAASRDSRLFGQQHLAFWAIAAVALGVLSLALFAPLLKSVFRVEPPSVGLLALAAAVGLAAGGWFRLVRPLARIFLASGDGRAAALARRP